MNEREKERADRQRVTHTHTHTHAHTHTHTHTHTHSRRQVERDTQAIKRTESWIRRRQVDNEYAVCFVSI